MALILLTCCLPFQPKANSQLHEVRRVFVFYELGLSSFAVALMDREMRATLEDSRYEIELSTESMDTDLFVDSHENFFAGIPIVFGGPSEQLADDPALDSHFTGCWEMFEPARTLDAALRLQPGSRHVVVVGGVFSFDRHLEAIFRESLQGYEASRDFTYLTDLDTPNLLERLKRLPDHTIVLYTHIGMDAKGTRYIGASQAGPAVTRVANAPVFGPSDVGLGHGEVGGYLESFAKEGKIVGGIALRILNGERPQDVPIVRGANAYMFDWRALRRWGFKKSSLPPGSAVLFRSRSFWERTKWRWVAGLLIILCLCVFILYVRLKRARHQQLGLIGMLITAQEKERSRLASEIHDDFSQRLAIIALELETAEEAIATSPGEAVRLVHNLLNSASELGADLHTLSHRLHSSTLESLGLVPGATALCKEFAIQQGIEIDFLAEGVPRSVDPDVALCLFRVVQEALRNVKKHSGASKGQVRLRRAGDKLLVSVYDEGVGFDVRDLNKKEGLGIRSMEERAHLLGGRLEIHSKPGEGTRIEASVPLQPKSTPATGRP